MKKWQHLSRIFQACIGNQSRATQRRSVLHVEALEQRWVPSASFPLTSIPELNSLPGAFAKLYLDFDGDFTPQWGGSYFPGVTPAYDQDGDTSTFSTGELDSIREIWTRVAEHFSPLNINVTTVDPGNLNDLETLKVVIGGGGEWASFGGLALFNSFSNPHPQFGMNIVWVFPVRHLGGEVSAVAAAASHEAGHGFGLHHQREFDENGTLIDEYSGGDDRRAPIMGGAYIHISKRAVWSNGLTQWPNGFQDELAILSGATNGFGYRPDDHTGITTLTGSNLLSASGIIEQMSDEDVFHFTAPGGLTSLAVRPAAIGAMLDADLELRNANGDLIEWADHESLSEIINAELPTGEYYLTVRGHGEYGDVGTYTVDVHFDVTAPTLSRLKATPSVRVDGVVRLAAEGIRDGDGRVVQVEFYRDADGNGVLNPFLDAYLGSSVNIQQGRASLEVSANELPIGHHRYFARLLDDTNVFSHPATALGTVRPVLELGIDRDPVVYRQSVTLDARGVQLLDTSVAAVKFYRDVDGNGRLTRRDQILGTDTDGVDGWTVTVSTGGFRPKGSTTPGDRTGTSDEAKGFVPFRVTYFAVAIGEDGSRSNVATTNGLVGLPPTINRVIADPDPVGTNNPLTLTALGLKDTDGRVMRVEFLHDTNNNGQLDSLDQSLGIAERSRHGFEFTVLLNGFVPGENRFFARVQDNSGLWSDPAAVIVTLFRDPGPDPV